MNNSPLKIYSRKNQETHNNIELNNYEITEIINSLTKSGKKIKIIDVYMKIIDLIEYIPSIKYFDLINVFMSITDLLEKVFLKFRLENKMNKISEEIKELNSNIFMVFKFYLFNDLEILHKKKIRLSNNNDSNSEDLLNKNNKKLFDSHKSIYDFIINNDVITIKNLKKHVYENFYDILNDNLCFFNVLLPKNNSIFKHSIKNEVLPFFLEIKIRISNVEYSEKILMELIKNIDITLIDISDELEVTKKNIPLSFSNTHLCKNEFEK